MLQAWDWRWVSSARGRRIEGVNVGRKRSSTQSAAGKDERRRRKSAQPTQIAIIVYSVKLRMSYTVMCSLVMLFRLRQGEARRGVTRWWQRVKVHNSRGSCAPPSAQVRLNLRVAHTHGTLGHPLHWHLIRRASSNAGTKRTVVNGRS